MAIEIQTKISTEPSYGKGPDHLVLEDAKFWGRPNFSGEMDRFKDDRRKFTVLIPNDTADQLRDLGWNVKTTVPEPDSDQEPLSHLKVMVDFSPDPKNPGQERGPDIWVIQADDFEKKEKLTSATAPILDRAHIENLDMIIRGWEYDPEERPGQWSARLVQLVAVLRPNKLSAKYGNLI